MRLSAATCERLTKAILCLRLSAQSMRPSSFNRRSSHAFRKLFRRWRCYTCSINPPQAIIPRRPTTPLRLTPWRKLTTLFYSSIISTVALADVKAKNRRRRQWQEDIAAVERDIQYGQYRTQGLDEESLNEFTDCKEQDFGERQNDGDEYEEKMRHALADVLRSFGVPLTPVPLGLLGRMGGPQSIYATKELRSLPVRWSPKKLITLELSVAKLAVRLWMAIPDLTSIPSFDAVEMVDLVRMLENINSKLARIPGQDPCNVEESLGVDAPQYIPQSDRDSPAIWELNSTLRQAAAQCDQGNTSFSVMLATIIRVLLTTKTPPEVSTMTIILKQLTLRQHYELAKAVCECMLDSHLRLDEIAADAMLDLYITADDKEGFNQFRLKMDGYNDGLGLANPKSRITWQRNKSRLNRYNNKVYQGIEPDFVLWHTLLRGHLHFEQIASSIKTFYRMTKAGIETRLVELNELLYSAVNDSDWFRGMGFWGFIDSQWMPGDPTAPLRPHSIHCSAIRNALKLCMRCCRWDEFEALYKRALRHGLTPSVLKLEQEVEPTSSSQYIIRLKRSVRVVTRQAEWWEIMYHRRARVVIGAQMRLAGHPKEYIQHLFRKVDQAARANEAERTPTDQEHMAYWKRLSAARDICERYFGVTALEPDLPTLREVDQDSSQEIVIGAGDVGIGNKTGRDTILSPEYSQDPHVAAPFDRVRNSQIAFA